jgi:hypothetical protein
MSDHHEDNPGCDFCSLNVELPWHYPVKPFTLKLASSTGPVKYDFEEDWQACADCHACIEADNWKGLMRRVTSIADDSSASTARYYKKIWEGFRAARDGDAVRVSVGE